MLLLRQFLLVLVAFGVLGSRPAQAELGLEAERAWHQARSLINQGMQRAALEPLRRAAELAAGSIPVHCDYMDLMTAQGYAVDVIEEYRGRRDRKPGNPDWHYLFGRATGDPDKAEVEFRRALELDPEHIWSRQGLGGVAAVRGELEEALGHYRRALALDPGFVQVHNKIAGIHYARGETEEAVAAWRTAMERAPDDYHAYLNMGAVLSMQGDLEGSAELLAEAVRRAPGNPLAYVNYGYVLFKLKRYDESLAHFAAALAINPRDRRVAGSRDLLLAVKEGRIPHEAFAPYEKALAASGRDPRTAAQHFEEVLLLAPGFAVAHSYLGLTRIGLGEVEDGLASLRKAVELAPDDPGLRYNLGSTLLGTEDMGEARRHLQRGHEIDPDDVEILSSLALAELGLGDPATAERSFRRALALQPRDPVLWIQLATAQAAQADLRGSAASSRKALEIAPGFTAARVQLVAILREDRRFDEALDELRPLEEMAPQHPEIAAQRAALEAARSVHDRAASQPGHVRLSRIYVTDSGLADEVRRSLDSGAGFDELARKHGQGPERGRSGDIGFVDPTDLRAELAAPVAGLAVGETTGAIDIGGAWVFLRRTE